MGGANSKFRSRPSKSFFKLRASFRSSKKKKGLPVVQNGSATNVATAVPNGNGSIHMETQTDLATAMPTPSTEVAISTVYEATQPKNETVSGTPKNDRKSRSSRSLAHPFRRTGSMRSNKSTTGSSWSLKHFGSLRSLSSRRNRRDKKPNLPDDSAAELVFPDPAEIPPINECHFTQLYEKNIHQNIFQYFNFDEKMAIRAVCKRWQADIFKEQPDFRYPLFRATAKEGPEGPQQYHEKQRQATASSNRYLYNCFNVQSLQITERLSKNLLENLCKFCFSKSLNKIEFTVGNMDKCDIIASNALEQFSAKFGKQFKEVAVEARIPNGSINNDLTDVILFLLYTNSEHFENLVNFRLAISNKLTNGYFQMFQSEFGEQLRHLSVDLCYDTHTFLTEASKTLGRIGDTMKQLKSLKIAILPNASTSSSSSSSSRTSRKLIIQQLVDLIELLPTKIEGIESFTLAVDIAEIDCFDLNLVKPMSRFTKAKNLSLLIYGDLKQMDESQLFLDFSHLELNHTLRNLTIDSAKISDQDIENLVTSCPNLRRLTIGCDVRVSLPSIYQITNLRQLVFLKISQCFGSLRSPTDRKTSGPLATKEALFIDTEALAVLLSSASSTMKCLREIILENCRIDMEDIKVLDALVSFTCSHPDEQFSIRLAHNRTPLILVPKFYKKYADFNYIPQNLMLSW